MSVPPEMMMQMQQPQMGDMDASTPAGAPMTAPSVPEGQRMAAMAQMGNVLDLMEQTLFLLLAAFLLWHPEQRRLHLAEQCLLAEQHPLLYKYYYAAHRILEKRIVK